MEPVTRGPDPRSPFRLTRGGPAIVDGTRGDEPPPKDEGSRPSGDLESTANLLARARTGDSRARDVLAGRYLTILRRLAHGRLPRAARGLEETDDIVQLTVTRALDHLDTFEPRREGAFLAYLRQILFNQLKDAARRANRVPGREPISEDLQNAERSPLEELIGRETVEAYEAALGLLTEQQKEAVVLRVEMGFTYAEVAQAIGSPSCNAARMLIGRALVRMAEAMRKHKDGR